MRCGGVAGGMRCGTYVVTAATSAQVALRGIVRDHCACCRRSMCKRRRRRRCVSQESRMWFNASPPDEKLRGAERSRVVFYPIHNPLLNWAIRFLRFGNRTLQYVVKASPPQPRSPPKPGHPVEGREQHNTLSTLSTALVVSL